MWKVVRWVLARIILSFNWIFAPRSPRLPAERQAKIDEEARGLQLYQFHACPFCVKVRREMRRLGLNVETRDASRVQAYREQLVEGGGTYKVPCLRIDQGSTEPQWLYESHAIVDYLRTRFASGNGEKH